MLDSEDEDYPRLSLKFRRPQTSSSLQPPIRWQQKSSTLPRAQKEKVDIIFHEEGFNTQPILNFSETSV